MGLTSAKGAAMNGSAGVVLGKADNDRYNVKIAGCNIALRLENLEPLVDIVCHYCEEKLALGDHAFGYKLTVCTSCFLNDAE